MKDATGELSMTAIAVVAIAAIAGIFTIFILPRIKAQLVGTTQCQGAICDCTDGAAQCNCQVYKDNGELDTSKTIKCPNPNKQVGTAATH